MGPVEWVKRHYYHYCISSGIYAFYPFERFVVNIFTVTLFSLMTYYTARSIWLGAVFVRDVVSPQPDSS